MTNMTMKQGLVAACVASLVGGSTLRAGETFTETFTGGSNMGGWTYGPPGAVIETTGGNPGAYLHEDLVDTFAPQPRTTTSNSPFTGNYRARGVTSVGIDLILHSVDFSAAGRPLSIMLVSDNGTPGNPNDDWAAYHIGPENIPLPGQGWIPFNFDIPSQETSLPAGWAFQEFGPGANPNWNAVIMNVTRLQFFYGDPELFFIFQQWNLGLDNPRITETPPVAPGDMNCDGVVDARDIQAFVVAAITPLAYPQQYPDCFISAGDFTGDNRVNTADVPHFVAALMAATD